MSTLWRNNPGFIEKYLAEFPGYYSTNDAGYIDERGYLHVMTRSDDVIKPAGHRISTGQLEEAINEVPGVVESAAVGYVEEIRGEIPLAFVVLKDSIAHNPSEREKIKELIKTAVRK